MTDLPLNDQKPLTMHIDLNSCYAIIEQQANPLIRHKPVAIAAYDSPGGFIIASSYEAKRLGIKLMRIKEAKQIKPDIIILTPDPEKYFDAHRRFRKILESYTNRVTPKSIDEFVVDFSDSHAINGQGRSMTNIATEIKQRIKEDLGEYVTVNIGIAPNRFLAKVAAGLDKPDGLDIITWQNLLNIYGQLSLVDLPGINSRYKARLNLAGILTPLDFLNAPMAQLKKQVFKSIVGYHWYLRLRGYEVDNSQFATKSFGNDYAVGNKTSNRQEVAKLIMKLCEKTGRRLRRHNYNGWGVYLGLGFENRLWWGKSHRSQHPLYATQDIYTSIMYLFNKIEFPARIIHINISVFNVTAATPNQYGLFDGTRLDSRSLAQAMDAINDKYGEYTITPASMANMDDVIIKRVPFGSVRDL